MVNSERIILNEKYRCSKCRKDYNDQSSANNCCKPKEWEHVLEFELKQEHLDLLKQVNIGWNECEFGAPEIDPKRPYGDSDIENNIAEIIKLKKDKTTIDFDKEEYAAFDDKQEYFDEAEWNEKTQDLLKDLHKQTQIALEIILHNQTFKLGKYKRKDYYSTDKWEFIG